MMTTKLRLSKLIRCCAIILIINFDIYLSVSNQDDIEDTLAKDIIDLKTTHTITFKKDTKTTNRKNNSVFQLQCLSGSTKCQNYAPTSIKCFNHGVDNNNKIEWECQGSDDLDKSIRLGSYHIECERYTNDNDNYTLRNSCYIRYTLEYKSPSQKYFEGYYQKDLYDTNRLSNFLSLLVMLVIILAVYKSCTKNRELEMRNVGLINGSPQETNFNAILHASVVHNDSDNNLNYHNTNSNNGYVPSSVHFPPPPPSYGYATSHMNKPIETEAAPLSTTTSTTTLPNVNTNSQNTLTAEVQLQSGQQQLEIQPQSGWSGFLSNAFSTNMASYFINRM
jgi:hypothetical protein